MTIVSFKESRMSKRRHKPSDPRRIPDPAEAARRGVPSEWGVNEEAMQMTANNDIEERSGRDIDGRRRERHDVFALLYYRPGAKLSTPAYDAVRRFQGDIAILHRAQGTCDAIRTSGQAQTGALALVSDDFGIARVLAGERLEQVLAGMKPWSGNLVRALCEHEIAPTVEVVEARDIPGRDDNRRPIPPPTEAKKKQPQHWKALVRKHTPQKRPSQAGETVRLACEALAESYRRIDNEPKEKVA